MTRLPLSDPAMTWEAFEDFCLDYVNRRDDVESAHFYGTRGSKQKGIDISAKMVNGETWAFQCRHWKNMSAKHVQRTVTEATYQADKYIILLTSDASTAARDECRNQPNWDIWDGRDLSREVRSFDPDEARTLLDANFGPAVRREFLGLDSVAAFLTPDQFFARFLNGDSSFNHTWKLVGREKELQSLHDFTLSSQFVSLLSGRGGAGKTKLLLAFSQEFKTYHPDMELRFLAEGMALSPISLDELPLRSCVVVVDDAHRTGDLKLLLELASQRATQNDGSATSVPLVKVILLSRPFARDSLRSQASAGVGATRVTVFPDLGRLSHEDVEQLAIQALGPQLEIHATQLARLTRDCPLVTTVGGKLLASGAVELGLLERSEEFRGVVLDRFGDEILGQIKGCEPAFARRLLELVSAVAPVRLDDSSFIEAMATFLETSSHEVLRVLDSLEVGGVLIRRGHKLRITPDVLSDHILHRACLTSSGQSTTFGERVLQQFLPVCLSEVVRNLAELDWRFRVAHAKETCVLAEFWHLWNNEYVKSNLSGRAAMLLFLKRIAAFQPEAALSQVETTVQDQANADNFYLLPPILRLVAYHPSLTGHCFDLLWTLGCDDRRAQNQLPDHPMRVLQELSSYDLLMGVPSHLNRAAIEACERWLQEKDAFSHLHSPLDVADATLAKSAISDSSHGFQVVSRAFVVNPHSTHFVREKAIGCVESCIRSGQERAIERAIESCARMIQGPTAYFTMQFDAEQLAIWLPEQRRGLELLAEAVHLMPTPFVLLKVSDALSWHVEFASDPGLRQRAKEIFLSLPDSFETRLVRCLSWHDRADYARAFLQLQEKLSPEEREEEENQGDQRHQIQHQIEEERFTTCLREFLSCYSDPGQGMGFLCHMVEETERRGLRAGWDGAMRFVFALARSSDEYIIYTSETVLKDVQSPMFPASATMLMPLRERDQALALGFARRFAQSEDELHQRVAATVYGHINWRENLVDEDWPILETLARSPYLAVRSILLQSLHWIHTKEKPLSPTHRERAIELLLSMDVATDAKVADGWAGLFTGYHPTFPLEQLSDDQCRVILNRLEEVSDIGHHHLQNCVVAFAARMPVELVRCLLRRMDNAEPDFRPVPYLHFENEGHGPSYDLKGIDQCSDYEDLLREVRLQSLNARGRKALYLPSLFQMVSLDTNDASLKVLEEWIDEAARDKDAAKLRAVGHLLSEAPRGFVYGQVPFVSRLLLVAHSIDRDLFRTIAGDLESSMTKGIIMSTPHEPAPVHVHRRDASRKIAQGLPLGSPQREFYELMARSAERWIESELARDEELEDEN